MEPGMTLTGGIIALIINGGLLWLRELRKHKTWTKNGDDLKEIKGQMSEVAKKLDCVDKKVGETKVVMDGQIAQCTKTVSRFDGAIRDQGRELIKLAGRKR